MSTAVQVSTRFKVFAGWKRVIPVYTAKHLSSLSALLRSPLAAGENYQVMSSDQNTIICYHAPKVVPLSNTKPLRRRRKVWEKEALSDEEVNVVRKLRQEDGYIWSVATLARLFKTSPAVISRTAPASEERQQQLEEEREMMNKMKPYKRKLYLLQREATRQKRLKELIAVNKYPFPSTQTESS